MKLTLKVGFWLVAVTLLFSGCTASKTSYSGFLKDYSNLADGPKGGADLVYKKPGVDFSKYNNVIIDKVAFYLKKDSEAHGVQPDVLKELSDTFEKELVEQINDAYPMVDKPGKDTMRVRIAITDVEPGNPALGTIGAVLPIGMAANLISNATTGSSTSVGSASIEAEIQDSVTGDVIAKAIDKKVGSTYDAASVKGKWGHSKKAFKQWAQMLRKWLDDVHGK